MGWIIFGVIALCITLFFWKNSYHHYEWVDREEEYEIVGRKFTRFVRDKKVYTDKLKMPLWFLILIIIGYMLPLFNVLVFAVIVGVMSYLYCEGDIYLHFNENSIMSKIIKFFNKDVF